MLPVGPPSWSHQPYNLSAPTPLLSPRVEAAVHSVFQPFPVGSIDSSRFPLAEEHLPQEPWDDDEIATEHGENPQSTLFEWAKTPSSILWEDHFNEVFYRAKNLATRMPLQIGEYNLGDLPLHLSISCLTQYLQSLDHESIDNAIQGVPTRPHAITQIQRFLYPLINSVNKETYRQLLGIYDGLTLQLTKPLRDASDSVTAIHIMRDIINSQTQYGSVSRAARNRQAIDRIARESCAALSRQEQNPRLRSQLDSTYYRFYSIFGPDPRKSNDFAVSFFDYIARHANAHKIRIPAEAVRSALHIENFDQRIRHLKVYLKSLENESPENARLPQPSGNQDSRADEIRHICKDLRGCRSSRVWINALQSYR